MKNHKVTLKEDEELATECCRIMVECHAFETELVKVKAELAKVKDQLSYTGHALCLTECRERTYKRLLDNEIAQAARTLEANGVMK